MTARKPRSNADSAPRPASASTIFNRRAVSAGGKPTAKVSTNTLTPATAQTKPSVRNGKSGGSAPATTLANNMPSKAPKPHKANDSARTSHITL